jgi:hypothetical protein
MNPTVKNFLIILGTFSITVLIGRALYWCLKAPLWACMVVGTLVFIVLTAVGIAWLGSFREEDL